MSHPIYDQKKVGSVAKAVMMKTGNTLPEDQETDTGLMTACEDILQAIETKDASMLKSALKAAFEIMEEMPHEEAGTPMEE